MGACGQRWETLPDTLTFALFLVVPAAETAGDVGANRVVTILRFGFWPVDVVTFLQTCFEPHSEAATKPQGTGQNRYYERCDYLNETPSTKNHASLG